MPRAPEERDEKVDEVQPDDGGGNPVEPGEPSLPSSAHPTSVEAAIIELAASVHQLRQRILNLEKAHGFGLWSPSNTKQWNQHLESRLIAALKAHDWKPPENASPARRRLNQASYEKLVQLASMVPVDRLLKIWTRYAKPEIPEFFVDDPHDF